MSAAEECKCSAGDPYCPCNDGDQCNYEGEDAFPPLPPGESERLFAQKDAADAYLATVTPEVCDAAIEEMQSLHVKEFGCRMEVK
jgi:hypothetical protein